MSAAKPAQLMREEAPQGAEPRDAAVYFRDGKIIGVETPAGVFTIGDLLWKRKLLSVTEGMILDQIARRMDKLVTQLEAK